MANSKTKRSWLGWAWRHKLLSLVVLAIVAAGAYVGYNHVQTSNNKRNFQQARSAIDSVYDDAIRNVGKPDNAEEKSSCSHTYSEFSGYSSLTCHLDTSFIYGVADINSATSEYKSVQNIIDKNSNFKLTKTASSAIVETSVADNKLYAASDAYSVFGLKCAVNYIFDTPSELTLSIKDSTKKPFEITIGCYGPAKQQYYRMAS